MTTFLRMTSIRRIAKAYLRELRPAFDTARTTAAAVGLPAISYYVAFFLTH